MCWAPSKLPGVAGSTKFFLQHPAAAVSFQLDCYRLVGATLPWAEKMSSTEHRAGASPVLSSYLMPDPLSCGWKSLSREPLAPISPLIIAQVHSCVVWPSECAYRQMVALALGGHLMLHQILVLSICYVAHLHSVLEVTPCRRESCSLYVPRVYSFPLFLLPFSKVAKVILPH